ncbi:hypothetical protein TeGR_g10326 [Tetraparma gracilis]|uniref:Uncharacterized protein n=1 Tax=Tetraparma gracilis TaxID=2962635 RepID=A0ABQ6N0P7_9STRA|nr:hypothetical protein TeGR_g10326 [Tetraparma gracilis]
MVVGSFLTFVGITYYVSDKVTVKSTMVQVKGMTTYERLVLFVLICYSPLVQNAAVMRRCITDPDLGWVLEADPRVSCEESSLRTAVAVHGIAVIVIMGVGLPYFVLQTMYNLRGYGKLSESNIYVALYEWYSPARPYWEAVLLAKKFVLIMASTTVIKDPLAQALIGTATNLAYLVLFELKRPMLMQPSRLLRGKNLFHMIERAASIASLIGSIIAVLGAASPGIVGVLGVLFALCNLAYATYVVGFFLFEEKKTKNLNQVAPDEKVWFGMSAWNSHAKLIDEMDLAPADREQMVGEMMLLRTKVLAAMEKELGAATGEAEEVMAQLAFANSSLTKMSIPASVKRVGEQVFAGCTALLTVELHDGVTEIGEAAFQKCSSLTELKIPASVSKLDAGMFEGCTALLTVELHDGAAFGNCTSLTEITIPASFAFVNCTSLTKMSIPASVKRVGEQVFAGCTALLTVELHDGVTKIGLGAFLNCSSLAELKIPASVSKLDSGMFFGCTALRTVELHDGVKEIGWRAFYNCNSLTEIKAALGTKIDDNAFHGCTALEAKAKAEGFSSVNKFVVERSMPETWAMRKGAEAGNLEQPASVAGGAAAGADEGKGRGDVGVAADPAALLEPVSGKPGERGEGDVDAAGNKDEAVCCNCGGSGRTKYPRFIDMCLGDETMIKEENVRTNTLHVEQGLWLLLCFGFLTGLWFGLWYLICVVAAGGSIAWPHGLSSPLYLVSFYGFSTLIDPKMSLLNHKQPNKPTALVMSHSPMQRDPMYPK